MLRKNSKRNLRIAAGLASVCAALFVICFANGIFGERAKRVFSPVGFNSDFDKSQDFVEIIDVGQGDSILVYSNGCSALIDAGLTTSADDIAENLRRYNISDIDVALVTHLHMDHAGGLKNIAEIFDIDNLVIPADHEDAEAQDLVNDVKKITDGRKGKIYTAVQGMNFKIGEFTLTVLCCYGDMKNENSRSAVVMAEIDGLKFLFTGDAESDTEKALLNEGINVDCDVLKVGHHGSKTSSLKEFIEASSPTYAAISVGFDNTYSHPSGSVLDELKSESIRIYRTDRNGDIIFFAENGKIRVKTEK